ncbi:Helix-turn-helix domain [Vibrio sp. B1FIG11]|uniref:MurR/RpiR family transcriptional regulator n=1 Tax=Vibrio sp. B1FIG11 TaxID=2751177 RepID=UPI001AF365D0|nr:MurR/RpiR family transcriptional regulator [Vibrio sp. B1FIG11]CAD7822242.1 Helix-turn-helix domain [Vibrio sp. B1FIG11]CAE6946197.1 Helix-turn-helix domain [Vibrio sp. B1FIG11]
MKDHLDLDSYKQLAEQLQPFTDSEAALNTFIIEHFGELSYYGIIDLAQKAKVSKATIGRYLNKLGYTGYSAFKHALKQDLIAHDIVTPIDASKAKSQVQGANTKEEALRYIFNVSQLIDQFAKDLDINELEKLAKLIADKSRTIYVVGPASSRALAIHFSTLLKYNRTEVILLPLDKGELPKTLLGIKEEDVLIAFSYYRFNPVVLDITKYFNSKNAHVIVITNTHSNPYGIYSNAQYVLPSDVDSIFHSRTIGFLFVELLLFLVQRESNDDDNFEELESLFKFFDVFSSIDLK